MCRFPFACGRRRGMLLSPLGEKVTKEAQGDARFVFRENNRVQTTSSGLCRLMHSHRIGEVKDFIRAGGAAGRTPYPVTACGTGCGTGRRGGNVVTSSVFPGGIRFDKRGLNKAQGESNDFRHPPAGAKPGEEAPGFVERAPARSAVFIPHIREFPAPSTTFRCDNPEKFSPACQANRLDSAPVSG